MSLSILSKRILNNRDSGVRAELFAKKFLEAQGLRYVAKNYFCRRGEIDLIMRHGEVLVFFEVRFRNNHSYGSGSESITASKQKKVVMACRHYLHHYDLSEKIVSRIDVISITPLVSFSEISKVSYKQLAFDWIPNAFC